MFESPTLQCAASNDQFASSPEKVQDLFLEDPSASLSAPTQNFSPLPPRVSSSPLTTATLFSHYTEGAAAQSKSAATGPRLQAAGGLWAETRQRAHRVRDLLHSVSESPHHLTEVAGLYASHLKEHLPAIVAITASFLTMEAASVLLAATPTGVGQLAAGCIQVALAAFGAKAVVDGTHEALEHGKTWLTLALSAHGDAAQVAAASREFLRMLVNLAMAALAVGGMNQNLGKGLRAAEALRFEPPRFNLASTQVADDGTLSAGGLTYTPGRLAAMGPSDLHLSFSSGAGYAGSRLEKGKDNGQQSDAELRRDLDPLPRGGESTAQAQARAKAARDELAIRKLKQTHDALGEAPPKIDLAKQEALFPGDAHTLERHGPGLPLRRAEIAPGERSVEGRLYGDPPWNRAERYSYKWLSDSILHRTLHEYLAANWNRVRDELALYGEFEDTFNTASAVGEGFWKEGTRVHYGKTSLVTIRLRLSDGNPPTMKVITLFPNGRGY